MATVKDLTPIIDRSFEVLSADGTKKVYVEISTLPELMYAEEDVKKIVHLIETAIDNDENGIVITPASVSITSIPNDDEDDDLDDDERISMNEFYSDRFNLPFTHITVATPEGIEPTDLFFEELLSVAEKYTKPQPVSEPRATREEFRKSEPSIRGEHEQHVVSDELSIGESDVGKMPKGIV